MASAIMQGRHKKLSEVRPDAGALAAVIERAMAHEPDARWQTARELGEALERELGRPLPGPEILSELFARVVPGEGSRQLASTPALEMAMTTATSSAPRSGDTETVVDSAAAPRHKSAGSADET